jgi:hypothetical protein
MTSSFTNRLIQPTAWPPNREVIVIPIARACHSYNDPMKANAQDPPVSSGRIVGYTETGSKLGCKSF